MPETERRISYAQNAEDIVLARAFGDRSEGFYVDVGAAHPTNDSVTRYFYERGWSGVNVEPQPDYFARLERERDRDVNLNLGVGAAAGRLPFYYVPDAPGISTFSEERRAEVEGKGYLVERREFPITTLHDVFVEHVGDRTVDFLKIDVEGLEEGVLGGFDWTRWRPRVVVVESEVEVEPWEQRMVGYGYRRTLWDGINVFLVREADEAALGPALSKPATVRDRFDPWLYVEQLRQAEASIHARIAEIGLAHADQLQRSGAAHQRQFARSTAAYERLLTETREAYEERLSQLAAERTAYLEAAITTAMGSAAGDAVLRAAIHALAGVVSERPDVVAAFFSGATLNTPGLLHWAASVTGDEEGVGPLVDHIEVFRSLERARGGEPGGVGAAKRLGSTAVELLRPRGRR